MPSLTMKDNIILALNNLRPEAKYPLIHFAKSQLDLDIEKDVRKDITDWALSWLKSNNDFGISKFVLSSLDNAIEYIQKCISKVHPKQASFFNYAKDTYADKLIGKYLNNPKNKDQLVYKAVTFAKKQIVEKILNRFSKNNIKLNPMISQHLKEALTILVNDIEDNAKTANNINILKNIIQPLTNNEKKLVLEKILQKKSLDEDSVKRFMTNSAQQLVDDVQSKVSSYGLSLIKKAQAREIYKYDGLIEHYLPASVRGLHDVDKSVVKEIALKGDNSKYEDLFNFEVASGARYNPVYAVGHTGASNRSSTPLTNIAMYFASAHGLAHLKPGQQAPKAIWMMIYEPLKGINTTELVDKSESWTELEFASPELSSKRFLGAVRFEIDPKTTDKQNIGFKAVDGFVAPRVHEGKFKKEGIEGDIKNLLDMAKYFDKPNGKPPRLDYQLPRNSKEVSNKRSFFQKIIDKLGLSHHLGAYLGQRKEQLNMVNNESDEAKAKRIENEKANLSFWHKFSEQAEKGFAAVKPWLPQFNNLVHNMKKDQQAVVQNALAQKLKVKY